jgi:tRNA dimethylallyltransferase
MNQGLVVVIVGPTASGKTNMAVQIAERFETEVISADARQFYAEMQIGTARPFPEELSGIPHHFLGHISITTPYGAGQYADEARPVLEKLLKEKSIAIVVGGSGLYIKAFLQGLDELPYVSEELRDSIKSTYEIKGLSWLQQEVRERDEAGYLALDYQNPARLMRALELLTVSDLPLKAIFNQKSKKDLYPTIYIGCEWSRPDLYERINERTKQMQVLGLIEEVRGLMHFKNLNALQTVGYTEIFEYLNGQTSEAEAFEKIAQHTRNYAKRQLTWFRNQTPAIWIKPTEIDRIMELITAKKQYL